MSTALPTTKFIPYSTRPVQVWQTAIACAGVKQHDVEAKKHVTSPMLKGDR